MYKIAVMKEKERNLNGDWVLFCSVLFFFRRGEIWGFEWGMLAVGCLMVVVGNVFFITLSRCLSVYQYS